MPLRPAAAHDLAAFAALVNSAYRGESAHAGWSTEADYITGDRVGASELEGDLADPTVHLLLLWDDAAPQTLLGGVRLKRQAEHAWLLGMLTVRPVLQASGHGRLILQGAEGYARARGARIMRMTVISIRDTLIAWYARRGYADTGEREPYTYGGALRPLEFAVLEKAL